MSSNVLLLKISTLVLDENNVRLNFRFSYFGFTLTVFFLPTHSIILCALQWTQKKATKSSRKSFFFLERVIILSLKFILFSYEVFVVIFKFYDVFMPGIHNNYSTRIFYDFNIRRTLVLVRVSSGNNFRGIFLEEAHA